MLCASWLHINLSSKQGTQSQAESCQVHQRGQHYPILCCCNWCWNPRPHTKGTSSFSYRQLYYESSCHNHQNTGNANAHEGTQLWYRQADSTMTVQLIWCQLFLVLDSNFCWHCYCFRPEKEPGEMAQWGRVHNGITRDQDSVSSTRKQSTAACYSSPEDPKSHIFRLKHAHSIYTAHTYTHRICLQAHACT